MKTIVGLLGSLPVLLGGLSLTSGALAQDEQTAPPAPPPQSSGSTPPAASRVAEPQGEGAQGQWVHTDGYGWVWVPAGAEATEGNAQPLVYLYAPTYGGSWFGSPWGFGPYRAGPWVHGGPRVVVRAPYRYHAGPRGGYGYHLAAPRAVRRGFGPHRVGDVHRAGPRR
jgi:hypothetical protein